MAAKTLVTFRKQIGDYAFARFLRNSQIPFELTYRIMFGKEPRRTTQPCTNLH